MNKLAELAARLLVPDERNAVLGDLAEAGESGFRALLSVLGLVVRRQAALWGDWRPWLALVGLVGIVAPGLWRMSLEVGDPLVMDIQTYLKYGSLYANGMTTGEVMFASLCGVASLVFWSWTSGFVLGSLSRRTIWTTGTLYYFHNWLYPLSVAWLTWKLGLGQSLAVMTAVQSGTYVALFVMPSFLGLRLGLQKLTVTRPRACLIAGISIGLTVLAVWTGGWQGAAVTRWGGGAWDASIGWPGRLLFFGVLNWPAAYLVATASATQRAQFTLWLGNGGRKRWKS